MLQWANRRSFFCRCPCAVRIIKETRPWLDACFQSFVTPFASKASSCDTHVKLSASKVSRRKCNYNQDDARVSESKLLRKHAHGHFSASGDATISVRKAARQDAFAFSHQDFKSHSVDGDDKVFESATCIPYAKTHFSNGDVRVTESAACGQVQSLDLCSSSIWDSQSYLLPNDDTILASSSKFNDKCLPSDVSNATGETLSPYVSSQTLVIRTPKEAQKMLSQKVELLESEQFSLSDAAMLVKRKAFNSCSFEQLSTVLQILKESFPSAKVVHDIVVRSSNILLEPVELVRQKLKLLYDFEVEEKAVSRLCGSGKVLSISVELLQKKLMFFKDMGFTVETRNMMFCKSPLILLFSIENRIQPTLNFFESIGLTRENILYLGRCRPEVFCISLDNNLIKKYEYFRQLGFSAQEFARACCVVGRLSIKSIEERMQSLKDLGFSDDDLLFMVKKQPAILCCSPEYTKCKLDFLICEQNRDMAEIVNDPSCLTFSLQGRMVPRFNFIKRLGDSKAHLLSSILKSTDSAFIKRFGKRKESSCHVFI